MVHGIEQRMAEHLANVSATGGGGGGGGGNGVDDDEDDRGAQAETT